eukprot:446606_1
MTSIVKEADFKRRVENSLKSVEALLDNTRHPVKPHCVEHVHEDKYIITETFTNLALCAIHQVLTSLQQDGEDFTSFWSNAKEWIDSGQHVTLRFSAESACTLQKKETKSVGGGENKIKTVAVEKLGGGKGQYTTTYEETLTEITEWHWIFTHKFGLSLFSAKNVHNSIILQSRMGETELITTSDAAPHPKMKMFDPIDVNITGITRLLKGRNLFGSPFKIDRTREDCHTPSRNKDIEAVTNECMSLVIWSEAILRHFSSIFEIEPDRDVINMSSVNSAEMRIFLPVIPMLDETPKDEGNPHFSLEDMAKLKQEQQMSFDDEVNNLKRVFSGKSGLLSSQEAILCLCLKNLNSVWRALTQGYAYMEDMLRRQISAAVGKYVQAKDISEYTDFHYRKLFKREYAPQRFQFDVRRGHGHAPEGTIAIEEGGMANLPYAPILTHTKSRKSDDAPPMSFPLNAAKRVDFRGEHFLHGYVQYKFFNEDQTVNHRLTARAQQFSSFVLMVGRITAFDCFEPQHAIIIKDKDEVVLPLNFNELPTQKEFNDAIRSLSPEQQAFCRALRTMQLESTLFAFLVVQIKPHLENLLRLPDGVLAKEIQLSQDLMQLFIDYQVPSDLLTYDGDPKRGPEDKLTAVKEHVRALQDMIEKQKEKELKDAKQEAHAALCERIGDSGGDDLVPVTTFEQSTGEFCFPNALPNTSTLKRGGEVRMRHGVQSINTTSVPSQPSAMSLTSQPPAVPPTPPRIWHIQDNEEEAAVNLPPDEGFLDLVDYTKVPITMESGFQLFDKETAIRPTKIKVGHHWHKTMKKGLLRSSKVASLNLEEQKIEKNRAMDLIDALSRSGDLSLDKCELHVVVGVTHCFDCSVMDTVVQKGMNPIEKIERSAIIVAETIHEQPAGNLLSIPFLPRIMKESSMLNKKECDEKKISDGHDE